MRLGKSTYCVNTTERVQSSQRNVSSLATDFLNETVLSSPASHSAVFKLYWVIQTGIEYIVQVNWSTFCDKCYWTDIIFIYGHFINSFVLTMCLAYVINPSQRVINIRELVVHIAILDSIEIQNRSFFNFSSILKEYFFTQ